MRVWRWKSRGTGPNRGNMASNFRFHVVFHLFQFSEVGGGDRGVNISRLPYLLDCLPYLFANCLPPPALFLQTCYIHIYMLLYQTVLSNFWTFGATLKMKIEENFESSEWKILEFKTCSQQAGLQSRGTSRAWWSTPKRNTVTRTS